MKKFDKTATIEVTPYEHLVTRPFFRFRHQRVCTPPERPRAPRQVFRKLAHGVGVSGAASGAIFAILGVRTRPLSATISENGRFRFRRRRRVPGGRGLVNSRKPHQRRIQRLRRRVRIFRAFGCAVWRWVGPQRRWLGQIFEAVFDRIARQARRPSLVVGKRRCQRFHKDLPLDSDSLWCLHR